MGSSKPPGNANLPIGAFRKAGKRTAAIQENGVHGQENATPEPVWHSRGYLPHFEGVGSTQHVIFHLADSLPQSAMRRFEEELKFSPDARRDAERRKRIDVFVDAGHGSCVLARPDVAGLVQETLLNFDSKRYRLVAWVVMPNHVHTLFEPLDGWTVAKIVASWKKFTARKICNYRRQCGEVAAGPVWHREYWDRYIRDEKHFVQTVAYIHQNPVKAGLVQKPEAWRWSSAYVAGRS